MSPSDWHSAAPRVISKSQLKHGGGLVCVLVSRLGAGPVAAFRRRELNNVDDRPGTPPVKIALNFTLASAATSYSASSDSAGLPSRPALATLVS